ncbi:hypothetical protein DL96DRAFT_1588049 [Flagelloscypha sp. PMI_526]|nr:hypothetical protein DL96DRAFT_1588049 [Flagelloscypha sp. PMI_526]
MQSLTTLTWRGSPWPGKQFFAVLSSLPNFRGLAVDCAQDDRGDPRALWDADTWENITEFFESSVASQIRDLKLLRITEDIYRILQMHLPSLTSCETFYLDLNCGLWSFDTTFGTPPGCPGENYDFHPFQFHSHSPLHTFTLITADLTLNVPTGGSLRLIEGFRQLKKLQILIQQGFPWRVIRAVRSFNAIDIAEGLSNLSHLIVTEADNHLPSGARYFPGFHQFISHLPRLSKLWVYRVVLLPLHGEDSQWDEWDPSPGQPLRTLSEFWESVEWTVIQPVLTQLLLSFLRNWDLSGIGVHQFSTMGKPRVMNPRVVNSMPLMMVFLNSM